MNYSETIRYLFNRLPMYQRVGNQAFKKDITNTLEFCKILDHPEHKIDTIHIAGTNGKGSVSHYLSSILQMAGYKTGLYTSPHLKDFRERIKVNGKKTDKEFVCNFIEKHKEKIEEIDLSFFELTVCMAFYYFAQTKVDIAVIETGLGGRLDSTNIINPKISVITNIAFDHTQMLGNTLQQIATEKAGIIKENTPIIIGETQNETMPIFQQIANLKKAELIFADKYFSIINTNEDADFKTYTVHENEMLYIKELKNPLFGEYQKKNLITVIQTCKTLNKVGFQIDRNEIKLGIEKVIHNSGIRGRWDVLNKKPLIICDIAHNEAGLSEIIKQIKKQKYEHLHMVIGVVKDKDLKRILPLFPKQATYYFCKPNVPRGFDANELKEISSRYQLYGLAYSSVKDAKQAAVEKSSSNDMIFIGGSTFVVAEVL